MANVVVPELIKGGDYEIPQISELSPQIYVLDQFLPSTGQSWATFASVMGRENWALFRIRVPLVDIRSLEKQTLDVSSDPIVKYVHPFIDHSPLVQEWLNELGPILGKRGLSNLGFSESFKEYFPGSPGYTHPNV